MMRLIVKSCIIAVVVAFVVELMERELVLHSPEFLHPLMNKLRALVRRDAAVYSSFLSTMAQMAAVFLGLYFTAISVVLSTVYAKVEGDVLSLVMREKLGNRYIKTVAFLGAYATILFALMALGYLPSVTSLLLTSVLGVAAIFSFVVLGLRTFQFFDPTILVAYLATDLIEWTDRATPDGFHWQDPSFQTHYQQRAEQVLTTYRNLITIANRQEHLQSEPLVQLARTAFSLLQIYEQAKLRIPSDSKWFKPTYRHKGWLTAGYSETAMALSTGTVLLPDNAPDLNWFEAKIAEAIVSSLAGLLERKDLRSAFSFSLNGQYTIASLAKNHAIDEALYLFRKLGRLVQRHLHEIPYAVPSTDEDLESLKFSLSLIDLHGLSLINILLGFSERLGSLTPSSLHETIGSIIWHRPQTLYDKRFPRKVVEQLEYLRKCLDFERRVEGRYVTPSWYSSQLVAISFLRFIDEVVNALMGELERVVADDVELLAKEGRHLLAAHLVERGLEACNKFSYHFSEVRKGCERLEELRQMKDIPWPATDWDSHLARVEAVRERLVTAVAALLPQLSTVLGNKELPDYFGHAYTVVAQECFIAMTRGNEALFKKLFPVFFGASITAHQQFIKEPVSSDQTTQIGFSAQPIIELFEISGYAIIFQELDGHKFWDEAKSVWDKMLSGMPNRKDAIDAFIAFGTYQPFMMFPRGTLHTTWRQELGQILRSRGIGEGMFPMSYSPTIGRKPTHPSPIIRVLGYGGTLSYGAGDFFTTIYFKDEIDRNEVQVSHRAKSLRDQIDREKARYEEESK